MSRPLVQRIPGGVAALAIIVFGLAQAEPAPTLNGIDVLERDHFAPLSGMRVGLITNHTGIDRERNATIDRLAAAPGVKLVALFSPEHGIRGALDQAKIEDSRDEKTGLPVYSLYGERRFPSPQQLAGLDALVFDIQDIGCRFYTYVSTLQLALEAAAKAEKKFIVLDRVNPVGGEFIEGPVQVKKESFVACHPVPLRHGMTLGELAMMFNAERGLHADLTVIKVEGWQRAMLFDETGLPWLNPSPNMRSLAEGLLYPGIGLLESAISVGRGTDAPFEMVGAPYADDVRLARELNSAGLAGVRFTPVRFTPAASVFKGQSCNGVRIFITDRSALRAVEVGVALAGTLQRLHPKEFKLAELDRLLQHPATLAAIREGRSWQAIRDAWLPEIREFERRRAPFLLY
jgi:uncharacterized protein YbbC (DUF1343 family)